MPLDLTDDEKAALIELLRGTIDWDRFPLSERAARRIGSRALRRASPAIGRRRALFRATPDYLKIVTASAA